MDSFALVVPHLKYSFLDMNWLIPKYFGEKVYRHNKFDKNLRYVNVTNC